jgi:hypothetical protein
MTIIEKTLIVICVLWLLSSLLHNNKEEALKENIALVLVIIACYFAFLFIGWLYS